MGMIRADDWSREARLSPKAKQADLLTRSSTIWVDQQDYQWVKN